MIRNTIIILAAFGALGACATPPAEPELSALPENVLAIAGPGQDLSTARLRPEDNCYWYEYRGPVETTLLPLKTDNGQPICAAA
jgi:hypothetical protein